MKQVIRYFVAIALGLAPLTLVSSSVASAASVPS